MTDTSEISIQERSSQEKAVFIGENLAFEVYGKFGTRDPRRIAGILGIKIEMKDKGSIGELEVFSSYNHRSKVITIYRDLLMTFSKKVGIDNPLDFLLAHEIFHHLLYKNEVRQRSGILNEISAHSFAIKLQGSNVIKQGNKDP